MSILSLISSNSFIAVNKSIIKSYGLHEAILLGALASKQNYVKAEWFYYTQELITEDTGLSRFHTDNAIESLVNIGILSVKLMGIPAKKHFFINEEILLKTLLNIDVSLQSDNSQVCDSVANCNVTELQSNINNNNNTYNKKENNKIAKAPTLELVKKYSNDIFNDECLSVIVNWIEYRKKEYKQSISEESIRKELNNIIKVKEVKKYSDDSVINAITYIKTETNWQYVTLRNVNSAIQQRQKDNDIIQKINQEELNNGR